MLETTTRTTTLQVYFGNVDTEHDRLGRKHVQRTAVGMFSPSQLERLEEGFNVLLQRRMLNTAGWFLDAGSGDGRVVALMAGRYKIPAIGVEHNRPLCDEARTHMRLCRQEGLLEDTPCYIIRGNFIDDRTYAHTGLQFSDIAIIFNFFDNESDIAAKISAQSPPGTLFVAYTPLNPSVYSNLPLEHTVRIYGKTEMFMHAYRKK